MNTNIFYLMFETLSSQIDLAIRKHQSWNGEQTNSTKKILTHS